MGTLDPRTLQATVVRLIAERAPARVAAANITNAMSLFEGGLGFDSLVLLEVVTAVEDATGIALGEDDLTPDVLANVGTLVSLFVRRGGAR